MTRVGLITNPRSRHNRAGDFIRRVADFDDLPRAEPHTTAELVEALADFRRRGVRVVAVSGGDGTLREVLTALPATYDGEAPDIALLPAGKTNLAARVVSQAGEGVAGLRRLLDAARGGALTRVEWPVLDIMWRDAPERRVRGFLFGAAGFAAGTQIANSHIHRAGFHNATAVALSIAATAASTLFGSRRRALLEGEDMSIGVDGALERSGRRFLTMATTLNRLILDLNPFWGEGPKPIRWLDVPAMPPRLLAALMPTLRGRPRPWMIDAGYASGRADEMVVEMTRPFVVDGELFDPGPRGILLSAGQRVGFVAP